MRRIKCTLPVLLLNLSAPVATALINLHLSLKDNSIGYRWDLCFEKQKVDRKSCGCYLNAPPGCCPHCSSIHSSLPRASPSPSVRLRAPPDRLSVSPAALTSCPASFTGEPRWSDRVCRALERRWAGTGSGSARACWAWVFGPGLWSWRSCSSSERKPETSGCSPARTPPPSCLSADLCSSSAKPSTEFMWV